MTNAFCWVLAIVYCAGTLAFAAAQDAAPAKPQIKIGYVEVQNDPRYEPVRAYERIVLKTHAHPSPAPPLALTTPRRLRGY